MKRKIICILLIAVLTISLTGCSLPGENAELRAKAEKMMDAILANDEIAAGMQMDSQVIGDSFSETFAELHRAVAGAESYELKLVGSNVNIGNGVTATRYTYLVRLDSGAEYLLTVAADSAHEGLLGFLLTTKEKTDFHYTGTLTRMGGASLIQWVVLLLGILEIAFVIWMLIDCCCRKIRLKAMWIVIILLGALAFSIKLGPAGMNFNFNLGGILSYTALILYGSGTTALRIMLPIGALVYLFCRAAGTKSPVVPVPPTPTDLPEAEPTAPVMHDDPPAAQDVPTQEPDPAAEAEDIPTQEPEQ